MMFQLYKLIILFLILKIFNCDVNKCKLSWPDSIGFDPISRTRSIKSIGTVNIAILYTDFNDAQATNELTPQQMFSKLSTTAQDYYYRNSYTKSKVNLVPHYQWLRMSKLSNQYLINGQITGAIHREYILEAANLANKNGFNFSSIDSIVILTNPRAKAYTYTGAYSSYSNTIWSMNINGKEILTGITFRGDYTSWMNMMSNGKPEVGYVLAHELGHNYGLPDLYAYSGSGDQHRFVGQWSVMGNLWGNGKTLFGWEKWLLTWLNDSQITCVTGRTTTVVKLSAIETIDNINTMKLIVIPVSVTQAVVVEVRRNLDDDVISREGLLVYLIDSKVTGGNGPIKVLPFNTIDSNKFNNVLVVGQSFTYLTATVILQSMKENIYQVQILSNYNF